MPFLGENNFMSEITSINKRIAKNTLLLYIRTFFVMLISIYTSRVILDVLGVDDYGVYQVVGGMVALFSVITNVLSASISRFITYEIGSGNKTRLLQVFSTSKVVQLLIAIIVFASTMPLGLWFLNSQMQMPAGRLTAAMWVLFFSLISFCISLLSIPYNACIIAHEHMKAFAYVSLIESILKLAICYLVILAPFDNLITYAVLMMLLSVLIRLLYTIYCHRSFEESHAPFRFYRNIFREIFGFAGWSFLTCANSVLCTHGITMIVNVYFGVAINAARGLATQVKSAISQFVNSFMVAINPQITKSYAAGEYEILYNLVCRGARFSYYLMLLMSLPVILEANTILSIWLIEVPEKTVVFLQLSMINILLDGAGYNSYTANLATGRIKKYSIILSITTIFVFPATWFFFACGWPVEVAYYIEFVSQLIFHVARMFLTQENIGLKVFEFIKKVYIPVIMTTLLSIIPSFLVIFYLPPSIYRFMISLIVDTFMVAFFALYVGMEQNERKFLLEKVKGYVK